MCHIIINLVAELDYVLAIQINLFFVPTLWKHPQPATGFDLTEINKFGFITKTIIYLIIFLINFQRFVLITFTKKLIRHLSMVGNLSYFETLCIRVKYLPGCPYASIKFKEESSSAPCKAVQEGGGGCWIFLIESEGYDAIKQMKTPVNPHRGNKIFNRLHRVNCLDDSNWRSKY